jgi:hypothetical protein
MHDGSVLADLKSYSCDLDTDGESYAKLEGVEVAANLVVAEPSLSP